MGVILLTKLILIEINSNASTSFHVIFGIPISNHFKLISKQNPPLGLILRWHCHFKSQLCISAIGISWSGWAICKTFKDNIKQNLQPSQCYLKKKKNQIFHLSYFFALQILLLTSFFTHPLSILIILFLSKLILCLNCYFWEREKKKNFITNSWIFASLLWVFSCSFSEAGSDKVLSIRQLTKSWGCWEYLRRA